MPRPAELSSRTRARNLDTLAREEFDLLVIGGGITGAGIVRDASLPPSVLPSDRSAKLIYSVKGTLRWDLSDYFAFVAEVYYNRDENRFTFKDSAEGVAEPTQEKPDILGFNTLLQARF